MAERQPIETYGHTIAGRRSFVTPGRFFCVSSCPYTTTWEVKDKATSQLARSDARLAVSGVNRGDRSRETVLPKVLTGGTAVLIPPKVQTSEGQCRVLLREIS